jgi:hypothetical protein
MASIFLVKSSAWRCVCNERCNENDMLLVHLGTIHYSAVKICYTSRYTHMPNLNTLRISVSWAYLTTKIITLWEFFNFVREVSHLYEWSSDCWCIWKSLGVNACLQ